MRRAAKIDANQHEIVDALRAAGRWVQSMAGVGEGFPDLLVVTRGGRIILLEVKVPGAKLTPAEHEWHKSFPGPVFVVRDAEDAIEATNDAIPMAF